MLRLGFLGGLALVVLGVAGNPGWAAGSTGSTDPFSIVVDHQSALFELNGLVPGPVGSRCLLVQVRNGVADSVVFSSTVGGTGLAPFLDLTIEAGSAVDPSTCGGFTGTSKFAGTLAELGTSHGDPTTGIAIALDSTQQTVLRFTLDLRDDNAAQGKSATARFSFDAQDLSPVDTTETPTVVEPVRTIAEPVTTVAVPTSTAVATNDAPTTTTTGTTTSADTTVVRPTRTTAPGGGTGSSATDDGPPSTRQSQQVPVVVVDAGEEAQKSVVASAGRIARATAKAAAKAAGVTAKTGAVPGALSTLVFGFMLIQARVDRNDPKLAAAPLTPEADLEFRPRAGRSAP